jgi:hypothetical protein
LLVNFFPKSSRTFHDRRRLLEKSKYVSQSYLDFGADYFDSKDLSIGYGGYHYDGRYSHAAMNILDHYRSPNSAEFRLCEIGCAKGFLLYEFWRLGVNITGYDLSEYAISNCKQEIRNYLFRKSASSKFAETDKYYDLLICKEMLPHCPPSELNLIICEMTRISKHVLLYIQCPVDESSAHLFLDWDPTHKTTWTSSEWSIFLDHFGESIDYQFNYLV